MSCEEPPTCITLVILMFCDRTNLSAVPGGGMGDLIVCVTMCGLSGVASKCTTVGGNACCLGVAIRELGFDH